MIRKWLTYNLGKGGEDETSLLSTKTPLVK
jgi:hypothetical protein